VTGKRTLESKLYHSNRQVSLFVKPHTHRLLSSAACYRQFRCSYRG